MAMCRMRGGEGGRKKETEGKERGRGEGGRGERERERERGGGREEGGREGGRTYCSSSFEQFQFAQPVSSGPPALCRLLCTTALCQRVHWLLSINLLKCTFLQYLQKKDTITITGADSD